MTRNLRARVDETGVSNRATGIIAGLLRYRRCVLVGLCTVATLFTVAGGVSAQPNARSAKPVLTFGFSSPPNFNPSLISVPVWHKWTFASLTHVTSTGRVVPQLAISWRYVHVSAGANKGFEFTLRRDARFSDGTPVTAAAVIGWFKYWQTNAKGFFASALPPLASIAAVGKWTVRMVFKTPSPNMPLMLSEAYGLGDVVAPATLTNPASLGTQPIGAGPYMLDPSQTVTNDHYTFLPNPHFYDKSKIRFSKVIMNVITNPSSMLQAAQTGQIQVAQGNVSTADAARAAGLNVVYAPSNVVAMVFFDRGGAIFKPLADVRVRQALNYAIDRKAISRALQGRYGEPSSEMMTVDGWNPKYQNYYTYDPAKARALLAAAGYKDGFTLKVLAFVGNNATPFARPIAKYLADVGVNLDITEVPGSQAIQAILSGTYPAYMAGRGGDTMSIFYSLALKPGGLFNQHGWSDPVMNKLWIKSLRTKNPSVVQQMSARTVTQAYFLPIATTPEIYYVSRMIGGVTVSRYLQNGTTPDDWFPRG